MNSFSVYDELDQAIDQVSSRPDATPAGLQAGVAELMEIARDLRQLPRTDFKMRLRLELEWQASGRAICKIQERSLATSRPAEEFAVPALFGKECSIYPVRRANFVTSVALHAAMFAFCVGLGLVMAHHDPIVRQAALVFTPLSSYVLPVGSSSPTGGGGSNAGKAKASKGVPRFADKQLTPPTVEMDTKPELPVEATLIGPADMNLPKDSQIGDPLSAQTTPSNGAGVGGDGLGPGKGPGYGPGSGGSLGGDVYSVGDGVSAPRVIYNPEPDFSEEARRSKYQGIVTLSAVIGADGHPRNLRVERSLGMGLDEKAIEAVSTWRFEPARKDGYPVAAQISIEVDFRLF